jgi:hypothetical protein
MSPAATVEYLLCFEGREAAARSVDGYLTRHPERAPVFWAGIHRFRREGGGSRDALQDVRNLASLVVSEELALSSPEGRDSPELARDPGAQRSRVIALPADIADELRNYGADEVASKVMHLRRDQLERLFELAAVHAQTGMLFAKALALAAVEVVEGHSGHYDASGASSPDGRHLDVDRRFAGPVSRSGLRGELGICSRTKQRHPPRAVDVPSSRRMRCELGVTASQGRAPPCLYGARLRAECRISRGARCSSPSGRCPGPIGPLSRTV